MSQLRNFFDAYKNYIPDDCITTKKEIDYLLNSKETISLWKVSGIYYDYPKLSEIRLIKIFISDEIQQKETFWQDIKTPKNNILCYRYEDNTDFYLHLNQYHIDT